MAEAGRPSIRFIAMVTAVSLVCTATARVTAARGVAAVGIAAAATAEAADDGASRSVGSA